MTMDLAAYLLNDTEPTDEDILTEVAQHLASQEPASEIDVMEQKLAAAYRAGIKLAREHGDQALMNNVEKNAEELEKVAILPLLAAGARMIGGQAVKGGLRSMAGNVAKEVGQNIVVDKATNALTRPRQAVQQAPQMAQASGGFKYANAGFGDLASKTIAGIGGSMGGKGAGTLGQKIVGGIVRNPGAALIGAGAIGGAVMAPRDPVTGEKQYLRGAMTGGALGGGAAALGAGNKLRRAVVSPKGPQIFGERAGAYARDATKATYIPSQRSGGEAAMYGLRNDLSVPHSAPAMTGEPFAPHLPAPQSASLRVPSNGGPVPRAVQAASGTGAQHVADDIAASQRGIGGRLRGLMGGNVNVPPELQSPGNVKLATLVAKMANRATLGYNPATKSFTRSNITQPQDAGDVGALPTQEPVRQGGMTSQRGPAPAGLAKSPGPSQVFSSHGGSVMSSSPASGVAARPQVAPRPIAAPPPIPALKSPIAAGAGAALKAAPKPPALPSLAGARSLVKRASMPTKKNLAAGGLAAGGAIAGGMLLHHKLKNKSKN
jgi:hypothetical protein